MSAESKIPQEVSAEQPSLDFPQLVPETSMQDALETISDHGEKTPNSEQVAILHETCKTPAPVDCGVHSDEENIPNLESEGIQVAQAPQIRLIRSMSSRFGNSPGTFAARLRTRKIIEQLMFGKSPDHENSDDDESSSDEETSSEEETIGVALVGTDTDSSEESGESEESDSEQESDSDGETEEKFADRPQVAFSVGELVKSADLLEKFEQSNTPMLDLVLEQLRILRRENPNHNVLIRDLCEFYTFVSLFHGFELKTLNSRAKLEGWDVNLLGSVIEKLIEEIRQDHSTNLVLVGSVKLLSERIGFAFERVLGVPVDGEYNETE